MAEARQQMRPFDASADGGGSGSFECSLRELKDLMTLLFKEKSERSQRLKEDYPPSGAVELCRRLRSSPVDGMTVILLIECLF